MKNLIKFLFLVCCICLLGTCKDNTSQGGGEDIKPQPIVTYSVTPIHGGAKITYSIPKDPNILYVMAEYERNGKTYIERASTHVNSLTIEGFNTLESVSTKLYTVNYHETKSDPKTVQFEPLESPVNLVRQSTEIIESFGGVRVKFNNPSKTQLGVRLMVDSLGKRLEKGLFYSSMASVMHFFRGFKSVETKFLLTYEDRWGNISDTIRFTGTPIFETDVPKPWDDLRSLIPYDNTTSVNWGPFSGLCDGIIPEGNRDGKVYLSLGGSQGSSFTVDLKKVTKLSRMAMWPYIFLEESPAYVIYHEVHIMEFEMWGIKDLDRSKLPPADKSYWLHPYSAEQNNLTPPWEGSFADLTPAEIQALPDCFAKDWVYLGRYSVERLDLMGASDEDILARGRYGHHFDIPMECDAVRYIRFYPLCTADACPPLTNYWQIAELSFWGDTTVPQD